MIRKCISCRLGSYNFQVYETEKSRKAGFFCLRKCVTYERSNRVPLSNQQIHQISVDLFTLFLPVGTDSLCLFLGVDCDCKIN